MRQPSSRFQATGAILLPPVFALLALACAEPATEPGRAELLRPPPPVEQMEPAYTPRPAGSVTFAGDIAPILYENCSSCHRSGEAGPFPLVTHEQAAEAGDRIVAAITSRKMPPWLPEPGYNHFAGERGLTVDERGMIRQWVSEGTPAGDLAAAPAPPEWTEGWQLGEPDLVVEIEEPYTVPASGGDLFQYFTVRTGLASDRWVRGYEFRAGSPAVHHAEFRLDTTNASRLMDASDAGMGFDGYYSRNVFFPDGHFLGWAPGRQPSFQPPGRSWTLPGGTDVVIQLHLRPTGRPEEVRPRLGLFFTDEEPAEVPLMVRLGSKDMDIPAGETLYPIWDTYTLPVPAKLLSVFPHAHFLGDRVEAWAVFPDGSRRWLLKIRDWDFNWQAHYPYEEPIDLPAGTTIVMHFTYDNSAGNPQNPSDPPVQVKYGPLSSDEMGDFWVQLLPSAEDRPALAAHYEAHEVERTIAYNERRLREGDDPWLPRNIIAQELIRAGRPAEAIRHLEAALELRPDDDVTHNNLAVALARTGDVDGAIEHLRTAADLAPRVLGPRLTLAQILQSRGDFVGAAEELARALEQAPGDPRIHLLRGGSLEAAGNPVEALAEYRRAVDLDPDWVPALATAAKLLSSAPEPLRDAAEATRLAEHAAEVSARRDAQVLGVLGLAYAASRRFPDAVRAVEEALALAPPDDVAAPLRQALALYREAGGAP